MAVVITATEQDLWPPRVLVSVTGLAVGDAIAIYRVVGGTRTAVRAAVDDSVVDTSFLRTDAELPFGVPVSYLAVVNDSDEYSTSATTYALPGGKVAVTDAINGSSAEVVILAWDEKARNRQASVFKVGARNVVVSGDLGMFEGSIELFTDQTSSGENLTDTLANATEGVVQIRQPGGYDGIDSFLSVLGVTERRFSQDGTDQRRVFTLSVAEVEGWAPVLEALGFTLQDIADYYSGTTVLNANPYFETNAANWTAVGGSVARSTAQFHEGVASLLVTPDGVSASAEARAELVPATAGLLYQVPVWVRCAVSRSVGVGINWYQASGTFISQSLTSVAVTANTWTLLEMSATAPALTGQARMLAGLSGTPPVSNTTNIDEAKIEAVPSLQDIANDYATLLAIAEGDFS